MSSTSPNGSRITVAQIVSGLGLGGGVEHVAYELAVGADPERYRTIMFCLDSRGELGECLAEKGIPLYFLRGKSSAHPAHLLRNMSATWRLSRLLRRERVDIVITHEFFSGTVGRVAASLARIPITILMLHHKDDWKHTMPILIDRLLAQRTDAIVANSRAVKEFTVRYENLDPAKFTVIHNGVETKSFAPGSVKREAKLAELGLSNGAPILTVVGRLSPEKGHQYLIEALPAVRSRFPDVRLLVVGDDAWHSVSTRKPVLERVESLGLTENVVLLGQRQDVAEILHATDIFVLPSLEEGFGLAIAEAMAAGRPIVASRVDGIPEVVEDGVTGILVPPRNPEALAEAIICLLDDAPRAIAMGRAGRQRVERNFSVEAMLGKWDELYLDLIQKKGLRQGTQYI